MQKTQASYMPQLDAVRAFAIFLVMIQHWAPALTKIAPWGGIGVRCFFVLSGFLITGILLRSRDSVESGKSTRGFQMRQFYIRRSLRIFPIYYLTLAAGCLLGMEVLRSTLWWHASYLSNFYIAGRGEWHGYISHLWSLAVEEQFYLLWPALILFLPARWLPRVLACAIIAAPLTRGVLAAGLGADHLALRVLLPCCLDSLVIGALLAWAAHRLGGVERLAPRTLRQMAAAAIAVMLALRAMHHFGILPAFTVAVSPTVEALFFCAVIAGAARGFRGVIGAVLDNRFLQYTGRISYGLYLYHMFARYVGGMLAAKLGFTFPAEQGALQFSVLFVMTYAAAALSARFIEAPINSLKRHFPATPPRARQEPSSLCAAASS